jgi:ATP-dependent Lhr-like helicase
MSLAPSALKARLLRTWSPFFARHGTFTPAQLAAIPLLLDGHNVILCAPTASGKTEAALAPLIERHLPPDRTTRQVTILYLLPTRALINDVAARLASPLESLRVTLAVKTHDLDTFTPRRPADLLLTTPESLDALLASKPKTLARVCAVVIDELHVLDGGVRGDQLRAVLARLRQVRTHAARSGDAPDALIQYVALSATLAEPAAAAARYFSAAEVVNVSGGRSMQVEILPLAEESVDELVDYLATFQVRGWRKALVFCNTRTEVEAYATAVRAAHTSFGHAVYVHYSNLESGRRLEIEQQFAQAGAAICFASSTLELGIDIGAIDAAILIGAPGSTAAFVQRIGRAGRRRQTIHAACFYRTPLEERLLRTWAAAPTAAPATAPFRPSVAVQQVFSLLVQSPSGALRLPPLAELFRGLLGAAELAAILGHLHERAYLTTARAGEWRAGERLKRLVDMQGRPLDVSWFDGEALWVTAHRGEMSAARLPYLSARQLLSFDLAQQLPAPLGLAPGVAPLVETPTGWLLFHWLGDVYGQTLLDLLRPFLAVEESAEPGLCVGLSDAPQALPALNVEQVERYLRDHVREYEGLLALGAYQHLLPRSLRQQAVVAQFETGRFAEAVARLHLQRTTEKVAVDLVTLLRGVGKG